MHTDRFSSSSLSAGFVLGVVLLILFISCVPKSVITPRVSGRAGPAPTELNAKPFHNRVNLVWKTNRNENSIILGYNVYVSEVPVLNTPDEVVLRVELEPYHDQVYPGDTHSGFEYETCALDKLKNGTAYYIFVTTLYKNGVESKPSNEVEVIPRPQSSFVLHQSYSGSKSGFSMKQLKNVPTDDLENDIYLAVINGKLFVASPSRLDYVLRETRFYRLAIFAELNDAVVTEMPVAGKSDVLQTQSGEVFLLQDADGCYSLLRFDSIDLKNRQVELSFIYQAKPNTLRF